MRQIKKLIVHCSASEFGDAKEIDRWHREKGWDCIGYHFVLCNGFRTSKSGYSTEVDGLIEAGRPVSMTGAHCKGQNADSIGICLIGVKDFTKTQMIKLDELLKRLMREYGLCLKDVYGHYEFEPYKTCPNMDMDLVRAGLIGAEHPLSEGTL